MTYQPEKYWDRVASEINTRNTEDEEVIAGDSEPYYIYKRSRLLELIDDVKAYFTGRVIMEVGFGPGGNLEHISKMNPQKIHGADLSSSMLALASKRLGDKAELVKIDGINLPYPDQKMDTSFTSTVLQHVVDEEKLKGILASICRVTDSDVFLFERVEKTILGHDSCLGRPVNYFESIMNLNGFELKSTKFINVRVSYYVCGAIRKIFAGRQHKEGESLPQIVYMLENLFLPLTKVLDKIFTSKKDVCRMHFSRKTDIPSS